MAIAKLPRTRKGQDAVPPTFGLVMGIGQGGRWLQPGLGFRPELAVR